MSDSGKREYAIEVRNLRKSYGSLAAVDGIDFHVRRGEVFALLGPNGAGKTTTVEILEGHRIRDSGDARVLGYDPGRRERSLKERIGIVLQETNVQPYLSVEETLAMFATYYPRPRPVAEVLALVGLTDQRKRWMRKLSGGQKRRVDVAVGLIGDPDLLFLDEPTTGFDPEARRGAWEMIQGLQALGKTILLTTHYMDEAQQLADRVAIIRRGKIAAEGSPQQLIHQDPKTVVRFRSAPALDGILDGIEGRLPDEGVNVAFETETPTALLYTLTSRARETGIELADLTVTKPTMEDTYLRLIGEGEAAL